MWRGKRNPVAWQTSEWYETRADHLYVFPALLDARADKLEIALIRESTFRKRHGNCSIASLDAINQFFRNTLVTAGALAVGSAIPANRFANYHSYHYYHYHHYRYDDSCVSLPGISRRQSPRVDMRIASICVSRRQARRVVERVSPREANRDNDCQPTTLNYKEVKKTEGIRRRIERLHITKRTGVTLQFYRRDTEPVTIVVAPCDQAAVKRATLHCHDATTHRQWC